MRVGLSEKHELPEGNFTMGGGRGGERGLAIKKAPWTLLASRSWSENCKMSRVWDKNSESQK